MRTIRLYVEGDLAVGQQCQLASAEQNYVRNVLRLQQGDELVLFNNSGKEYPSRLKTVAKKLVELDILADRDNDCESSLAIELGQAITKGDRMDFSVQKSVELGVGSITPLFTQHGVVAIKGDRLGKKQQHWQKVAISAAEQCGRAIVPPVEEPIQLLDWIASKSSSNALKIVLQPGSKQGLVDLQYTSGAVVVLIGPEGGLSEDELEMAAQAGFIGVSLGRRILRAETATVAVMSAVQLLWGDLK